jgi:peptidase E
MGQQPTYLIAGGLRRSRGENLLWSEALASAGKAEPSIAYVGAAAGDSAPFRLLISSYLKRAGAGAVRPVRLCGRRPDVAAARGILDSSDIVFVSGGDVEAGLRVLEETGMPAHLRTLAAQGKAFVGLSAGSILLSRSWVRWRDPGDDASAELFDCLSVAHLYCDMHDEDSGWSELKALLRLLPDGEEGWGIPAGGALVAHADGRVEWRGHPPARLKRAGGSISELPL